MSKEKGQKKNEKGVGRPGASRPGLAWVCSPVGVRGPVGMHGPTSVWPTWAGTA